jgi:hypothetical protein
MCQPANSDAAARAALESAAARPLTDAEWERARTRLVEFVTILRDWDWERKAEALKAEVLKAYRGDNVVRMRAKTGESLKLPEGSIEMIDKESAWESGVLGTRTTQASSKLYVEVICPPEL